MRMKTLTLTHILRHFKGLLILNLNKHIYGKKVQGSDQYIRYDMNLQFIKPALAVFSGAEQKVEGVLGGGWHGGGPVATGTSWPC